MSVGYRTEHVAATPPCGTIIPIQKRGASKSLLGNGLLSSTGVLPQRFNWVRMRLARRAWNNVLFDASAAGITQLSATCFQAKATTADNCIITFFRIELIERIHGHRFSRHSHSGQVFMRTRDDSSNLFRIILLRHNLMLNILHSRHSRKLQPAERRHLLNLHYHQALALNQVVWGG